MTTRSKVGSANSGGAGRMRITSHRCFLLAGAAAALLGGAAPAMAQQAPAADDTVERVTVTGSRIARTGMATPTPVTALGSEELTTLAPTTMMDAMNLLPQFANSNTPSNATGTSGSAGQSILNLRGIGANRTLVLLDGRRVVSSNRRGTVDIGVLPESLVERVEVVTGGASAAYGSDAVAGVVNFILDTDYTGVKGHLQGGISDHGDNENVEASVSTGFNLGSRGHVLLSVDAYRSEGVRDYQDRKWAQQGWGVITIPGAATPARVIAPDVRSRNWTFGGMIPRGPLVGTQFLTDGTPAPFVDGDYRTTTVQSGGSGEQGALFNTLVPKNDRASLFTHISYDLTDNVELFGQYLFGYNKVTYYNAYNSMATPWEARIYADNAYLPDSIRNAMLSGSAADWAAFTTPSSDPVEPGLRWFPFGRQGARDELSRGQVQTYNQTHSFTTGLNADVSGWDVNAYYQYGKNRQKLAQRDLPRVDRAYRSMDAVVDSSTGRVVCRSTLSNPNDGCIPSNFFGAGSVDPQALDWIVDDRIMYQDIEQHFAELSASGEVFEGWAGPISLAMGASYREDSFDQTAFPVGVSTNEPGCTPTAVSQGYLGLPSTYASCHGIFERGSIAVVNGDFNVWEAFAETVVPLASGRPLMQSLDFQGGIRYADYSGSGGVVAWKAGLDWQMNDELRLRGTLSRDTRAGTLSERYDQTRRGNTAEDPLFGNESYAFTAIEGGNEAIAPEKADTLTLGFVYQPTWLNGFSLSVDYYDIKIDGAIALLGTQNIIDRCYSGTTEVCSLITRDPVSNRITSVLNTFLNVDEARTRGVDMEAVYRTPLDVFGPGNLTLRGILSYVDETSTTVGGGVPENVAGQNGPGGVPDWRGTLSATYALDQWRFNVTGRYIAGGLYDYDWVSGVDISDNDVAGKVYFNAQVAYDLELGGGSHELFLSVSNLFNATPDRSPGSAQFNANLYEEIGRTFTAGLRFSF